MKTRNKLIVLLLAIGVILFGIIQGYVIPEQQLRAEQYANDQLHPATHDLKRILPYKSQYMGDASNLSNLFTHLPLSEYSRGFQLYPEELTAQVNYSMTSIKPEELNQALMYNSAAAFALIDNLEAIIYNNIDNENEHVRVTRALTEQVFGEHLPELLTPEQWKEEVQRKLEDKQFVANGSAIMLVR